MARPASTAAGRGESMERGASVTWRMTVISHCIFSTSSVGKAPAFTSIQLAPASTCFRARSWMNGGVLLLDRLADLLARGVDELSDDEHAGTSLVRAGISGREPAHDRREAGEGQRSGRRRTAVDHSSIFPYDLTAVHVRRCPVEWQSWKTSSFRTRPGSSSARERKRKQAGKPPAFAKKVLLHYGGGSIRKSGLYDRVLRVAEGRRGRVRRAGRREAQPAAQPRAGRHPALPGEEDRHHPRRGRRKRHRLGEGHRHRRALHGRRVGLLHQEGPGQGSRFPSAWCSPSPPRAASRATAR